MWKSIKKFFKWIADHTGISWIARKISSGWKNCWSGSQEEGFVIVDMTDKQSGKRAQSESQVPNKSQDNSTVINGITIPEGAKLKLSPELSDFLSRANMEVTKQFIRMEVNSPAILKKQAKKEKYFDAEDDGITQSYSTAVLEEQDKEEYFDAKEPEKEHSPAIINSAATTSVIGNSQNVL